MLSKRQIRAQMQLESQRLVQAAADATVHHDEAVEQANQVRARAEATAESTRRAVVEQARRTWHKLTSEDEANRDTRVAEAEQAFRETVVGGRRAYDAIMHEVTAATVGVRQDARLLAAAWGSAAWETWAPTDEVTQDERLPRSLCLGTISESGQPQAVRTLQGHGGAVRAVAFFAGGSGLVSAGEDGTVRVWDIASERERGQPRKHTAPVNAIAVEPLTKLLASGDGRPGGEGLVRLWTLENEALLHELKGHTGAVLAVALSADGKKLALTAEDRTVRLWDALVGQFVRPLGGHERPVAAIAFSPDSTVLATGCLDGRVRLWEVASGRELRTFGSHSEPVRAVAFSPGGTVLATAGDDRVVRLWDVAGGRELRTLTGHTTAVTALAFSPDGTSLYSGSGGDDRAVRRWDASSGRLLDTIRDNADVLAIAVTASARGAAEATTAAADTDLLALGTSDPAVRLRRLAVTGEGWQALELPALAPFLDGVRKVNGEELPGGHNLIFKVPDNHKDEALGAIRALMLRLLALVVPGKVRFTFFDPVGLGDNVGAFMELNEHSPALTGGTAWTEPGQIEQRLTELTEHMSMVTQTYLRGRYEDIEAYNADVGEVTEPYRVVVGFDFPVNVSETAYKRLVSIAERGPRLGVYTVLLINTDRPLPAYVNLAPLERWATVIAWDGQRFVWQDDDFRDCTLTLDQLESMALEQHGRRTIFGRVIREVGTQASETAQVKVPFTRMLEVFQTQLSDHRKEYPGIYQQVSELTSAAVKEASDALPEKWLDAGDYRQRIGPDLSTLWRSTTQQGLIGLLGRVGAKKVQCLALGTGAAHHVLVAGRTGSGKTTMVHTLITSLALTYSPLELQLYLVDLKKGVEFQIYDLHHLPHARVVAVSSEREYAGSVLDELDKELTRRGEVFREQHTPEIASYRAAHRGDPQTLMPRILLVIDEFQELFAANDSVGQRSAQILDRLVRQGRGFGMHVLLGSQSLASAFTTTGLGRSTLDQMAARVALACSEADSHLILANDNPRARQLIRKGQAIFNDSNGRVEGNSEFQVAYLRSAQDDGYQTEYLPLPDAAGIEVSQDWTPGEQDRYLSLVRLKAREERERAPELWATLPPSITWDGSRAAQIERNDTYCRLLKAAAWSGDGSRRTDAWLGEPIAIKPPVVAGFKRAAGRNLLVIGQEEESIGLAVTTLVTLAAQHAPAADYDPAAARFYVLDFTDDESPLHALLPALAEALPHHVRLAQTQVDARNLLTQVVTSLARRTRGLDQHGPPIYLTVYGLQRNRDLRAEEAGAGRRTTPLPPSLRGTILQFQPPTGAFPADPIVTPPGSLPARPVPPAPATDESAGAAPPYESFDDWQRTQAPRPPARVEPVTLPAAQNGDAGTPDTPIAQLLAILRDGPEHGIYTLAFCDSTSNLLRAIERSGLKEFGMRVAFAMSANDSRMILDTNEDASRLSAHRALFYDDGTRPEKFQPYGAQASDAQASAEAWTAFIRGVGEQLRSKGHVAV